MSDDYVGKDVFGNDIFMGKADAIKQQRENIDRLLLMIGEYMGWEGDISHVFVSDLSQIGDFCLGDAEVAELSRKLGFDCGHDDYLHEIALRMKPKN